MNIDAIVRRLAALNEPDGTILTLTLDVSASGILPDATRVFLRDQVIKTLESDARSPAAQTVLRDLGVRIRRFADAELRPETNGVFLVAGARSWEPLELAVPLRNSMRLGRRAHLASLFEATARWPRALVVSLDARAAVVREFRLGVWSEAARLEAGALAPDTQHAITGRGVIGGGMRDRFVQSSEEFTATMARDAAERVRQSAAEEPLATILVFGRPKVADEFRTHLPERLRERAHVVGAPPEEERDLRRAAADAVEAMARERTEREVLEFHDRRAHGRLTAAGPAEVIDAADRGRVARVFLDAENPVDGVKCDGCGRRYAGLKARCDSCTGDLVPVSLAQEVILHGLAHPRLPLTFVPPGSAWLREAGGMAALLTARALRRKSQ